MTLSRLLHCSTIFICLCYFGLIPPGCQETTEPSHNGPKLGKRDYVWSYDTITHPQSLVTAMRSMYGTSSDNVYIVGHCEVSAGRMWHYGGADWKSVNVGHISGSFEAISGIGPNDIWVAGAEYHLDSNTTNLLDSALVARYNGSSWSKVTTPRTSGLTCISAFSSTSVWAGGTKGAIIRFDGNGWTKYELGEELFIVSIAAESETRAFAIANREDRAPPLDSAGFFVYRFDGTSWAAIDTAMRIPGSPPRHFGLRVSAWSGVVYTLSPNVYRYTGYLWEALLTADVAVLWQSAPNNIIAAGRGVFHYNGIDWFEFTQLYPALGHGCYTDGNEVFIVGNNDSATVVLHGR